MLPETPLLNNNVLSYNTNNSEWAKERLALQRGLGGAPVMWIATDEDMLSPLVQANPNSDINTIYNNCKLPAAMLPSCYSPPVPDSSAFTNESGSDGAPFSGQLHPTSASPSTVATSGLNVHNKQDEEDSIIPLATSPTQLSMSPLAKAMVLGNVNPVWCPSPSVPIGTSRIQFVETIMWNAIMRFSWIYSLDLDPNRHFSNAKWLTQPKSRKRLPPPKDLVRLSIIHALCDESALTPILHLLEPPAPHRLPPGKLPWDNQGAAERPAPAELIPFPLFVIEMSRRLKVSTFIFLTAIRWIVDLWESGIIDGVRAMENCGFCKSGLLGCQHFAPGVLERIDLNGDGPGGIRVEEEERDWSYGRPFGVQKNVFNPKKAHQEKIRQAQERQRARMDEEAEKRAEEDRKATAASNGGSDPAQHDAPKPTSTRPPPPTNAPKSTVNPFDRPKAVPLPSFIKALSVLSPLADPKKAMLGALILANKVHRDRSGANKQFAASVGLGLESVTAAEKAVNVALGYKLTRSWVNIPQHSLAEPLAQPQKMSLSKTQQIIDRSVMTLWPLDDVSKTEWQDGSCDPSYAECMLGWGKADVERIGVKALRDAPTPDPQLSIPINVTSIVNNVRHVHDQASVKLQDILNRPIAQPESPDETIWDLSHFFEYASGSEATPRASTQPFGPNQYAHDSKFQPIPHLHVKGEYPAGLPRFNYAALMLEDLQDDVVPPLPPTPKAFTNMVQMPLAKVPSTSVKRKHTPDEQEPNQLDSQAQTFKRQKTETQQPIRAHMTQDAEMADARAPANAARLGIRTLTLAVSDSEDTPELSGVGSQSTAAASSPIDTISTVPSRASSVIMADSHSVTLGTKLGNNTGVHVESHFGVASWLAKIPQIDHTSDASASHGVVA